MDHNQASTLDFEEVAQILGTDLEKGLTSFEARERLKKYGPNKLNNSNNSDAVRRLIVKNMISFLGQFVNPLIQILLICVVISASLGEYENAISVSVSILIVCSISYIQESKADKSLEKLSKRMPNVCKVMRESQTHEMESSDLVPGDIVYLTEGQRVPADVRLYDSISLTVNESNLTGETLSQAKISASTRQKLSLVLSGELTPTSDTNLIYQNLAMMGTLIESGHSRGIVISTGKSTRYGQVYSMLKSTVQPRSPLQLNIDQLSIHLVVISCSIIALMSILGIIQRREPLEVAYYAISLAVTAIPEGLPVAVAVIMALGVLRLSRQKIIVRSMTSIETLGCIQVFCADKTGTLTRNDMTLTDIVTSELHSVSSNELEELNNEENRKHMTFSKFGGKMFSIGRLMEVGTLCNNASFDHNPPEGGAGHYIGQATECAILDAAVRMGFGDSRTKFERIGEVPFCSRSRRMVVQCKRQDLQVNSPMFYVKGAWEDVLNDCSNYYDCGLIKPRNEAMWLDYSRICTTLGSQGLRVLALATGPSLDQLTFVGIVGINNALREGIPRTMSKLKIDFGIDIKMITGDCKATAVAVGHSLGLIEGNTEELIMSGEQLQELLSSEIDEISAAQLINSRTVFYRVDPIQKASIVSSLQRLNKIVAMTGDGVNDVISLKRANLSIVMGSGADVCKEIADVVLVENDLSLLPLAVVEGKGIYYKIHSFMSYQISISLSLVCLVTASFAARIDAPFTVIQLLFLNILADGPPAQALGVEKIPESDLHLNPRNVHEPILSASLLGTLTILTLILVGVNGNLYYYMVSIFVLVP